MLRRFRTWLRSLYWRDVCSASHRVLEVLFLLGAIILALLAIFLD